MRGRAFDGSEKVVEPLDGDVVTLLYGLFDQVDDMWDRIRSI